MRTTIFFMAAIGLEATGVFAQDHATRVAELDRKLSAAQTQAEALQATIAALAAELRTLKAPPPAQAGSAAPSTAADDDSDAAYREQIVRPDLGSDERGHELAVAPELFVQTRFQALAMDDTSVADAPTNFDLSRMEARWAGRLSPKVGMGFEIQYHPAPDGSAFELVNDAFVEYLPHRSAVGPRRPVRQALRLRHSAVELGPGVARTRHLRRVLLPGPTRPRRHAAGRGRPRASSVPRRLQRQPLLRRQQSPCERQRAGAQGVRGRRLGDRRLDRRLASQLLAGRASPATTTRISSAPTRSGRGAASASARSS